MIKLLIESLEFLRSVAPLLTSVAILTLLCILLSKSIRKNSTIWYIVFSIPFILVSLPSVMKLFGVEMSGFVTIPFLGEIVRDYIHMGTLGHPLLIIIMYMGALDPKVTFVKKLLSIRKELSIICGFPVLAHSLIRVMNNLPGSFQFFANKAEYLEKTKVVSELGAGISSFSFILGIIMLIIFIPLWVTSFDWVRKYMTYRTWKKVQTWAYVLYATLFIHAIGIQTGGMLNPRGGQAPRAAVEAVALNQPAGAQSQTTLPASTEARASRNSENTRPAAGNPQRGAAARPTSGGRTPTWGFADIKVSAQTKRYISIASLILIYGSYLILRIRKAKKDAARRTERRA